jgi:hypothetical protein
VAHVYQLHTLLAIISDIYQYPQHVRKTRARCSFGIYSSPARASYAFANLDDVRPERRFSSPADLTDATLDLMGNERGRRSRGDGPRRRHPRLAIPRGRRDDHRRSRR